MHRCAASASTGATRRLVLTALAVACASAALPVQSQALMRRFPRNALRGEIAFALAGNKYVVNFTVNSMGLVQDVWILRPDEIRMQPWPRTPVEAQTWAFNEGEQTWKKP
jgi:hypothetical protein